MKIFAETERLILREILPTDEEAFFEMDSDPEVHRYLGNKPVKSIEQTREVIANIRNQYEVNGIGRWAAIEKSTGNFIGWSGLKFITTIENNHTNFYDVGYRLARKYWGKGYATESAKAALEHGFTKMNLQEIIGSVHKENVASRRALQKCGLIYVEDYEYETLPVEWMKITRNEWQLLQP